MQAFDRRAFRSRSIDCWERLGPKIAAFRPGPQLKPAWLHPPIVWTVNFSRFPVLVLAMFVSQRGSPGTRASMKLHQDEVVLQDGHT